MAKIALMCDVDVSGLLILKTGGVYTYQDIPAGMSPQEMASLLAEALIQLQQFIEQNQNTESEEHPLFTMDVVPLEQLQPEGEVDEQLPVPIHKGKKSRGPDAV